MSKKTEKNIVTGLDPQQIFSHHTNICPGIMRPSLTHYFFIPTAIKPYSGPPFINLVTALTQDGQDRTIERKSEATNA